ncbi:DUF6325 family protein [Acetobacterium bakii]|uniref:DUF1269 domain-containing family protein n=1 Tax=Acetobacterium bakii TaxID=52689 RepID=A0A0L6TZB4_9FIRM|nr:DUF6325 family protein [Acetobacterium bakii]KNZ41593.1 hypothetical protein AKG39_11450 [Acetobacterium bakii]
MHGPIDFIVVGFEGNKFNGEVLDALGEAVEKKIIDVLDIAVIAKDEEGQVHAIELSNLDNDLARAIDLTHVSNSGLISLEDTDEVAELLDNNSAAGLLIIEQLWAKDLKKALLSANGRLLSEGRIHPDAAGEIETKEAM